MNLRDLATDQDARTAYFADPANANHRLWIAGGAAHGVDFGYLERDTGLQIVDFFGGKRPYYCDANNPTGHGTAIAVVLTLMLDSNVAGDLLPYIEGGMRDPVARAQVEKLLSWFASTPLMNITPAFNLIERFVQSANKVVAEDMAFRTARAILDVETMDREYFLATGTIRAASDAAQILLSQTGSSDFDAVARQAVNDTTRLKSDELEAHYAFLLKTALIGARKQSPKDLLDNVVELISFTENRFGIVGPLEFGVALLHFARLLRKFVTIGGGMTFEQVTSRIQHASWDMAYLRTPTMFLKTSTVDRATFPFIITSDQDAASILRIAEFQMLLVTPERTSPFISVDTKTIRSRFGRNELFDQAMEHISAFVGRRPAQPNIVNMKLLIDELHAELRRYLSPGSGGKSSTS